MRSGVLGAPAAPKRDSEGRLGQGRISQTRLNGLGSAIDGVTVAMDDDVRLRADTLRTLAFGFGAKLSIHPRQVHVVHAAMAMPSSAG